MLQNIYNTVLSQYIIYMCLKIRNDIIYCLGIYSYVKKKKHFAMQYQTQGTSYLWRWVKIHGEDMRPVVFEYRAVFALLLFIPFLKS